MDADTTTEHAIATLTLAFSADPGMRWLFPEADRYLRGLPDLLQLAGGPGFAAGTVYFDEARTAVAVWAPPGSVPDDDAWGELFVRHVAPDRLDGVFAWGAAVGEHHPTEPHWYLASLGVDPGHQGRGLGSALLRAGLERCDRDGLPAYLESGNPRNRTLYERRLQYRRGLAAARPSEDLLACAALGERSSPTLAPPTRRRGRAERLRL